MSITAQDQEKRRVLEMLSAGSISVDEAQDLLEALKSEAPRPEQPQVDQGAVNAVKVVGTFRALKIIGDPSVKGAVGVGPHRARQEGGTLIFEEMDDDDPGFTLFGPPHFDPATESDDEEFGKLARVVTRRNFRFQGTINGKDFKVGRGNPPVLKVRMNPSLPLDIEMTAGAVKVIDVTGPIKANLTAGSGRFSGIHSPIEIGVEAGTVNVEGLFDEGTSSIHCTAGRVRVELAPGSDVTVTAKATLGKVSLPHSDGRREEWQGIGTGQKEIKIGQGTSSLDIDATTGSVVVDHAGSSHQP